MITEYKEVRCTYPYQGNEGDPKPGEMQVLYNEAGTPEMVNFLCPCGCGNACPTHVMDLEEKKRGTQENNAWKKGCWGFDPKTLTLHPSIRWISGCKAHFWIKNGKVEMCGDSGK